MYPAEALSHGHVSAPRARLLFTRCLLLFWLFSLGCFSFFSFFSFLSFVGSSVVVDVASDVCVSSALATAVSVVAPPTISTSNSLRKSPDADCTTMVTEASHSNPEQSR